MDILDEARKVFETELQSINEASQNLDDRFVRLVDDIRLCKGRIIIVGIGKSSHIGAKVAATMASLGTPAFFVHPAESLHGDLGRITSNDIVLFFSKSGESEEINRMMPSVHKIGAKTVAITCSNSSTLSRSCDYYIYLHITNEASAYNLAPTSSATVMMVFGDALAVCLEKIAEFTPEDYAVFHPGGMLGKKLLFNVTDIMAKGDDIPRVSGTASIKEAIYEMSSKSLAGGVAITDDNGYLLGVFTDGDLRRLLRTLNNISMLEENITTVMTSDPVTLNHNDKAAYALSIMEQPGKPFGILPILYDDKKLAGMISIHDLIKAGF